MNVSYCFVLIQALPSSPVTTTTKPPPLPPPFDKKRMSCCAGNCGCGSSCKCGNGCNGCGMYPDLSYSEKMTTDTVVVGFAPVKMGGFEEAAEMSFGAENGCKCGSNCSCTNCTC